MHKKTAVPNILLFGTAVMRYIRFSVSALKTVRQKHFMLRKWQHRQVAPLAIQTPTDGGLCIGCAVLPAQREYPPRPPLKQSIRSGKCKASAGVYAEAFPSFYAFIWLYYHHHLHYLFCFPCLQ